MAYSSLAIANEFIRLARSASQDITHMQLQKLVYLAHGWNMAINKQPLIEDEFEAWEFGPVIRRLYDALKRWGKHPVGQMIRWGDDTGFADDDDGVANDVVSPEERAVIDKVWKTYGKLQAFQLSALTHEPDTPWYAKYQQGRNHKIPAQSIREYFVKLALKSRATA
ncbi:MAG: SocA family protein [Niveispirillum sp.]|nr:SocA family protein [Niveispirillum sp.]